ncbi:MAG TPA: DEAD/DEAH box helicase [Stellaceae bacterium]|nr:DEAD/DEAH box helicase [Stellaceae bacterium]
MSFEDLGLSPEVLKAVADAGYTAPTPIQEQAIPYVLMGRDVLGCAQTGTGKTASFTLPMIDILAAGRARARMPRSLIIEPTRELAAQVAEAFDVYGKYHKLDQALLIGGESFADQERKLDRGVDVLIATPGRLIDLYERGKILLSDVKILVIDEADRMLDMGFIPDVERIVGLLSKIRQTLFFSATMPPEIRRLADAFLMNPKEITVAPPASPATTVTQGLAIVNEMGKREALRRLIRSEDVKNAIIFCNRKRDVDVLFRSLTKHGFDAAALHGDMPQSKRTETLERFKNSEIRLLVASDVAARGLDVQGMSHVFNFDVPIHAEDYVHRIGRTGRAGREGRAFTLATPEDGRFVEAIQQLIGKPIPSIEIPGIETETFSEGEDAPRSRGRGGRGRGRRGGKSEGRSGHREERPQAAKPARERPSREHGEQHESKQQREPKREPAHAAKERPAAKEHPAKERAAYAPITMNPDAMDQALPSNVTKLPRRDHQRDEQEDDRRVVGFGDHMPAFLSRARAVRSV